MKRVTVGPLCTHVPETSQGGFEPAGGGGVDMKFSCDVALSRIPAPHLLKQEQGAFFRD